MIINSKVTSFGVEGKGEKSFIYFWLCLVFVAAHRLSPVSARGYPSLQRVACALQGLSRCGARALDTQASVVAACGLVVAARGLWGAGSVTVAHGLSCPAACGVLPEEGWTSVPCIGSWSPIYCMWGPPRRWLDLCPLHWQLGSHLLRHSAFQGRPYF